MFTGLIKEIGIVKSIRSNQEGMELVIKSNVYNEIADSKR